MASIKEHSVTDDEMGMFWRDTDLSWWWYRAPIETQAMMIEAFDEVMNDQKSVEDCKVWMLKQKQTQDWKTTKATADAVYSLLLRGSDLIASNEIVQIALAGEPIKPKDIEAGTGFYEARVVGSDVKPDQGNIVVKKIDKGVAWGSVLWGWFVSKDGRSRSTTLLIDGLQRRCLGKCSLAIHGGHVQSNRLRRHSPEADKTAIHQEEHAQWPNARTGHRPS